MIKKYYIEIFLILGLIFIPAFMSAGRSRGALAIFFALLALLIFVRRNVLGKFKPDISAYLIAIFFIWLLISTFIFSSTPYNSFLHFLPLAGSIIIFLTLSLAPLKKSTRSLLAEGIVLGSSVVVIVGLYHYISTGPIFLRSGGIFFQHNALAGFLILPLLLSFWTFVRDKARFKLFFSILSVIIFAGFIVTFSRGGFISVGISIIIFLIILFFNESDKRKLINKLVPIILITVISVGFAYSMFTLKKNIPNPTTGDTEVNRLYKGERPELGETSLLARFHYMNHAVTLFLEKPLEGHGLGSFGANARRVQQDFRFYSTDPHNLYLKMFAELGFVGGALFIVFILSILIPVSVKIYKKQSTNLTVALFASFIGILIHNGADIDFMFRVDMFLFFLLAALLVDASVRQNNKFIYPALLFIGFIFVLVSGAVFNAWNHFDRGMYAYNNGNREVFIEEYNKSLKFNPFDVNVKLRMADIAHGEGNNIQALAILEEIEDEQTGNSWYYRLKGNILEAEGELGDAEDAYRRAIELAPRRDLDDVVALVSLLKETGKMNEARVVAQGAIERFPKELLDSGIWTNPDKNKIRTHVAVLEHFLNTTGE